MAFPRFYMRRVQLFHCKLNATIAVILCMLCCAILDYRLPVTDTFSNLIGSNLDKKGDQIEIFHGDDRMLRKRKFLGLVKSKINETHSSSNFDATHKLSIPSNLTLIIVVCSRPENVQQRQTIRMTWGSDVKQFDNVAIVFLIGKSFDRSWHDVIQRENVIHKDIVIVDVIEQYKNLSMKLIAGMKWVLQTLSKFGYYMKTDDDVYINIQYLLNELKLGVINSKEILGAININSTVIRDKRDDWSISYDMYYPKTFPIYASGGGYVMSVAAIHYLLDALPGERILHLEDVFITGILAQKAGLTHVGHKGFAFWSTPKANACDIVLDRKVTSVNMSNRQILKLYNRVNALLSLSTNTCVKSSDDIRMIKQILKI